MISFFQESIKEQVYRFRRIFGEHNVLGSGRTKEIRDSFPALIQHS